MFNNFTLFEALITFSITVVGGIYLFKFISKSTTQKNKINGNNNNVNQTINNKEKDL